MHRLVRVLVMCLAAAGLSALSSPDQASASGAVPGLVGVYTTVSDDTDGRLFVSQGSYAEGILALDLNGAVVDTLTGIGKVYGMTLNAAGNILYAVSEGGLVRAIDPGTLDVTQTYQDCESVCGYDLTTAGGLIWFSNGWYDDGTIGALDPSDGTVTAHVLDTDSWLPLFSTPARPNSIYGWSFAGYGPDHYQAIIRFDVGTDPTPTLTQRAIREADWTDIFHSDMAFSPDGQSVIAPTLEGTLVLDSETLAVRAHAPIDDAQEVAVSAAGLAAGGGPYDTQLFTIATNVFYNELVTQPLVTNGIAFVRDRLYLFEEAEDHYDPPLLRVVTPAQRTQISITLGAKYAVADRGVPVTVRGPAGRTVQFDTYAKKVSKNVLTKRIPASGVLKARVPMQTSGCVSAFSIAEPGHEASEHVDKCLGVQVAFRNRMLGGLGKRHGAYVYRASDSAVMETRTIPDGKHGMCVYFTAQVKRGSSWRFYGDTGCVRLDDRSTARVGLAGTGLAGKTLRLHTRYLQDKVNLGATSDWTVVKFVA